MTFSTKPTAQTLRRRLRGQAGPLASRDPSTNDRAAIDRWFRRLHLLHGVPFNYLVPDERMLPPESIRFFVVDDNWMTAMIDGAFGIGASKSAAVSEQIEPRRVEVVRAAARTRRQVRTQILAKAKNARATDGEPSDDTPTSVSGFLLRSVVVSGWPGLEVRGYADTAGTRPLTRLRIERLSSSVLLALFEGVLARVDLQEPPEGVQFGVVAGSSPPTLDLRYAGGDEIGQEIGTNTTLPLRTTTSKQVFRANDFAQAVIGGSVSVWPAGGTGDFTAAQFAIELANGVELVSFEITTPSEERAP